MVETANPDMLAAWDGNEGAYWAANHDKYESASAAQAEHLHTAAAYTSSDVVLDIGCGNGGTTMRAARAVPDGRAVGVDLSSAMLDVARQAAAGEGLTNVEFVQADAQVHDFGAPAFDVVVSSFGCMFFADPVAAYRNIGSAMNPGGRLRLLAWRALADNEWMREVIGVLAAGRDLPSPPPDAPGPFGFAGPDHVRRVLTDAGFTDVELDPVSAAMTWGATSDGAFEFVKGTGVTVSLLAPLDEPTRAEVYDELRALLSRHETPHGVRMDSASWLISATRTT